MRCRLIAKCCHCGLSVLRKGKTNFGLFKIFVGFVIRVFVAGEYFLQTRVPSSIFYASCALRQGKQGFNKLHYRLRKKQTDRLTAVNCSANITSGISSLGG
jgi:hypothetical protein